MSSDQRRHFGTRPLIAGSILGLRVFHVSLRDTPNLIGVIHADRWWPGENTARCVFRNAVLAQIMKGADFPAEHDIAAVVCTCGFHAYFSREKALTYGHGEHLGHESKVTVDTCDVVGIIEGYGTVTVGDYGFRAEKARVRALVRTDGPVAAFALDKRHVDFVDIARHYPDAAIFPSIDAMLAEFPLSTPAELEAAT